MLLKPKNKGRFCQINTGEGKSSIVSILATIKALKINMLAFYRVRSYLQKEMPKRKKIFIPYLV